jgi:hypothetical protein
MQVDRRTFLAASMSGILTSTASRTGKAVEETACKKPVRTLHVSDLFRPHNDPDDHWDLACAYALAAEGSSELVGIFIDYPQLNRQNDPDVLAVAQMNYLTGKAVPVMVGAPEWLEPEQFERAEHVQALRGIRAMLKILRASPEPIVIHVLGSCRDVAMAGRMAPEIFAEKCAAIYLNAGSGTPNPEEARRLEWNVHLDPRGYATVFQLPCPIYWMPCFHRVRQSPRDLFQVGQYGTYFRFRQGDILPRLTEPLQNYFAYTFLHGRHFAQPDSATDRQPNWFGYLFDKPDAGVHQRIEAMERNMWCTGGFLHSVGKTVERDGRIVLLADAKDPVFTFDPVTVTCTDSGVTKWRPGNSTPPRHLFHVRDQQRYATAMTNALRSLLVDCFK